MKTFTSLDGKLRGNYPIHAQSHDVLKTILGIAILAVLCVAAFAQDAPNNYQFQSSGTAQSIQSIEAPKNLVISNGIKTVVTLSFKDGSVTFGEGVTPDAAAKAFWDQVTRLYPQTCKQ